MRLIRLLVRTSKPLLVGAMACGVLSGMANAGLLALIGQALSGERSPSTISVVGFFGLALAVLTLRPGSQILLSWIQQSALQELRTTLGRRILATPLRRLEEVGTHRLLATLTTDVLVVSGALQNLPQFLVNVALMAGCLGYLALLSWRLLLGTLVFMAVGALTYWFAERRALTLFRAARNAQDGLMKQFRALTESLKELKLLRHWRTAFIRRELMGSAESVRRLQHRSNTVHAATTSWGLFLFFLLIGLILHVLPRFSLVGTRVLTGYTLTLLYMLQPLEGLMAGLYVIGQGNAGLGKIESLTLSEPEELPEPAEDAGGALSFESLELVGVTHTYYREQQDECFILGPINLRLEPGELVFFVGGNGSGKTTLAKLLVGLYTPELGETLLNGRIVTEPEREQYRQLFAAVFSDFHLFDRLLGAVSRDKQEPVRRYLDRLHLAHKVKVAEGGQLSTTELSQGQRKRLALLAAYLENRPIYLFDEWASDQDPEFRKIFYEQLLPDLKRSGKTVLVISHDAQYFHLADRLCRLDFGKLVEEGLPVTPVSSFP